MELTTSVRAAAGVMVAVIASALVASCSHGASAAPIAVGAGDSAQSELIAEIYAGALARTGARTVVDARLGRRTDYLAALDAGRVAVVGDESGDLLAALDSRSPARIPDPSAAADSSTVSAPAGSSEAAATTPTPSVSDALSRALPEGLAISDIADGTDLRAQFVLAPAAAGRFPHSLKDLAAHCGELTVGIATGHQLDPLRPAPDPRRDVLTPLRQVYGCDIAHYTVLPDDTAARNALRDGRVQAAVLTAPAALLPGGPGAVVGVADPEYAFRAQNVVPLFRQGALTDTQIKKLNYVAGELTTDKLTEMVRRIRDDHADPGATANAWLDEHNL
ncbi:osmoprotectant transport system substrate-binding protein [Nocardia sp. GAS34]|uniref:glycine betaine ABC transporter substrate-binding protein n=1 Tax=unclassified Nocardia TaxID=2637762 RepID=UPI003D257CA0